MLRTGARPECPEGAHPVLREGDAEAGVRPYRFDDPLIHLACLANRVQWHLFRPPGPMVVLGRGSRLDREIDLRTCSQRGMPIFRRYGGGCSVVLDPGTLVVAIVFPTPGLLRPGRFFETATDWLLKALRQIGIPEARRDGVSDLVAGDRKIGGSCLYQTKDFVYFSATILIVPDIPAMASVLRHPPREPAYRKHRAHEEFLLGIGTLLGNVRELPERIMEVLTELSPPDHPGTAAR